MMSKGKVVVVTGANKGIGYCVVKQILQKNPTWTVYLTARDVQRGEAAVKSIKDETNLVACFHQLDIDSIDSIRNFKEHLLKTAPNGQIDILVNNAGIAQLTMNTEDNADDDSEINRYWTMNRSIIKTNYHNCLLFCEEIFPLLAFDARVVMVSSCSAEQVYSYMPEAKKCEIRACRNVDQVTNMMNDFIATNPKMLHSAGWMVKPPTFRFLPILPATLRDIFSYGLSKLGLILLTQIFQQQFRSLDKQILINACCPGMVTTDLNPYGWLTPDEGAESIVELAFLPADSRNSGGQFFFEGRPMDVFSYRS